MHADSGGGVQPLRGTIGLGTAPANGREHRRQGAKFCVKKCQKQSGGTQISRLHENYTTTVKKFCKCFSIIKKSSKVKKCHTPEKQPVLERLPGDGSSQRGRLGMAAIRDCV